MFTALDTMGGAGVDTGGAEVVETQGEDKGKVVGTGEMVGTLWTF